MRKVWAICRRELTAYFATPLAYVFIAVFSALAALLTFTIGNFLARGMADLTPFFAQLPWLLMVLAPALAMRLWAEERGRGTIELLMTMPITPWQMVLGKWLAAWMFLGAALLSTFGLWITVNWLGEPDNGVIALGYAGAWFTGAVLLAAGAAASALTRNQVIAFVLAALLAFLLMSAGTPLVQDVLGAWLPRPLAEALAAASVLTHFSGPAQGMVSLADAFYWLSMTAFWLFMNVLLVRGRMTA